MVSRPPLQPGMSVPYASFQAPVPTYPSMPPTQGSFAASVPGTRVMRSGSPPRMMPAASMGPGVSRVVAPGGVSQPMVSGRSRLSGSPRIVSAGRGSSMPGVSRVVSGGPGESRPVPSQQVAKQDEGQGSRAVSMLAGPPPVPLSVQMHQDMYGAVHQAGIRENEAVLARMQLRSTEGRRERVCNGIGMLRGMLADEAMNESNEVVHIYQERFIEHPIMGYWVDMCKIPNREKQLAEKEYCKSEAEERHNILEWFAGLTDE